MDDRLPPSAIDLEEACLGSIIIEPQAVHEVSTLVKPDDFYRENHRWIFEAMLDLADKNTTIDFQTLAELLNHRGQLEDIGGEAYLIGLINSVPSSHGVESYAKTIHSRAVNRRMILAASAIANFAYEEEDSDKAMDMAENLLYGIREEEGFGTEAGPVKAWAAKYLDRVEELSELEGALAGLPTGFIDMDRILGGLPSSSLIVIAARPSMGKTALMLQIATENALNNDLSVGFFSLEMSGEELMQRMASTMARIDSMRLRRGDLTAEEWPKFHNIMGKVSESGLLIDDTPGMSPSQIRSRARQWATRYGLDLIVVDYMQLMNVEGKQSRVQEISAIGKGLKNLARELKIPVIVGSQLNRAVESRANKRPQLSDLRDSGTIEEDGDIVAFIYRDDYYNTESSERPHIAEIIIGKNRNGPAGVIDLYWQAPLATFRDLARQEIQLDSASKANGKPPLPPTEKKREIPLTWQDRYD
jgi:replicative DNA helicase